MRQRLRQALEVARGYRPIEVVPRQWEQQYADGTWDWLDDISELGRYSVVTGYVRRLAEDGGLLDVGCGEGLLLDHVGPHVKRYVGIDLSREAVRQARERRPHGRYLVGDAATLDLAELDESASVRVPFDVVVLNECLYYFADPLAVARRYEQVLAPGGALIVSMFAEVKPSQVWAALADAYATLDEVAIAHPSGKRWTVRLLRPRE